MVKSRLVDCFRERDWEELSYSNREWGRAWSRGFLRMRICIGGWLGATASLAVAAWAREFAGEVEMAVRLSYALISVAPGWGQPEGQTLKIHIVYASGRSLSLPERFPTAEEARQFIERFYPDLIGKCTGIDKIQERKPMKFPAGKEVSRFKKREPG